MSSSQLERQVTREIQDAIGEIMSKYGLVMRKRSDQIECEDCGATTAFETYYELQTNYIKIDVNIDILEKLLPIEYGKAK